jgi:hypothetical protein
MMTTLQKWLLGLVGLGALYLAVTNPTGVYNAAKAVQTTVGGSETEIITGGKG